MTVTFLMTLVKMMTLMTLMLLRTGDIASVRRW
jgi:hypothetical protein